MIHQQLIKQTEKLTKQDFVEYMHKLQHLAPQRYNYNIFLEKMTKKKNKETDVTKKKQQSFSRTLGGLEGKITTTDTFNDPLEDFTDYM